MPNLKTVSPLNGQMPLDDGFMADGVKSRWKHYTSEVSICSYEILTTYNPENSVIWTTMTIPIIFLYSYPILTYQKVGRYTKTFLSHTQELLTEVRYVFWEGYWLPSTCHREPGSTKAVQQELQNYKWNLTLRALFTSALDISELYMRLTGKLKNTSTYNLWQEGSKTQDINYFHLMDIKTKICELWKTCKGKWISLKQQQFCLSALDMTTIFFFWHKACTYITIGYI